mmetsp:Transcript_51175/g.165278  ORF Transcript_51175/g.165278 Transcript_51175/m.165278 type:complete len:223 (-) Transcript_51175:14-682(-)
MAAHVVPLPQGGRARPAGAQAGVRKPARAARPARRARAAGRVCAARGAERGAAAAGQPTARAAAAAAAAAAAGRAARAGAAAALRASTRAEDEPASWPHRLRFLARGRPARAPRAASARREPAAGLGGVRVCEQRAGVRHVAPLRRQGQGRRLPALWEGAVWRGARQAKQAQQCWLTRTRESPRPSRITCMCMLQQQHVVHVHAHVVVHAYGRRPEISLFSL